MKISSLIILLLTVYQSSLAENNPPLTIGDFAPNIEFKQIVHFTRSSANLDDFKDKIIILDFWATWCQPCVFGMPKLDTLQRKYPNDIVVLPVTDENDTIASAFFKKKNNLKLPSVVNGSYLKEYFPHTLIPHSIILDKNRKVIAITSSENITATLIDSIIAGYTIHTDRKKDILKVNLHMPLMVQGNNEMYAKPEFRAMILPCMPDMASSKGLTSMDGRIVGLKMVNNMIPHLFLYALERPWQYSIARMLFENVKDTSRYISDKLEDNLSVATEWAKRNLYSFDLIAPGFSPQQQKQLMLKTLQDYFRVKDNLEVSLVKRGFNVFVLKTVLKRYSSDNNVRKSQIDSNNEDDDDIIRWFQINTKDLAFALECYLKTPVIDSTFSDKIFNIQVTETIMKSARSGNPTELLDIMHAVGLDISPGIADIEAILFKEN